MWRCLLFLWAWCSTWWPWYTGDLKQHVWIYWFISGMALIVLGWADNNRFHSVLVFGVPQRSVLGPLPYILHVTDLIQVITAFACHFHQHADEVCCHLFDLVACHLSVLATVTKVQVSGVDGIKLVLSWPEQNNIPMYCILKGTG